MLGFLLGGVGFISLGLGIISGLNYLAFIGSFQYSVYKTKVSYSGGKFWLVAFLCLVAFYLKG